MEKVNIDSSDGELNLEQIVPQLKNTTMAQSMVVDMINRRRNYFNGKSSYKKMSKIAFEI